MPIENRNLTAGTRLVANYKKQVYVCTVEEEDGKTAFVLEDGKRFKSPSSAASAVMGGKAVNGWRFWSVEGERPEAGPHAAKPKRESKAKRGLKLPQITLPDNLQGPLSDLERKIALGSVVAIVAAAAFGYSTAPSDEAAAPAPTPAPAAASR